MGYEEFSTAMANRSVRTIRAELEFLSDSAMITPQQLSTILSNLPGEAALNAVPSNPTPVYPTPAPAMANLSLSNGVGEKKKTSYYDDEKSNGYTAPPPAYPAASPAPPPAATPLTHATSLYAYNPTDAGDLALLPNDRVAVTEYMNAEWWKGRNERTNMEGIFPRSYVKLEEKLPVAPNQGANYGNMPLDVSNGAGSSDPAKPSKGSEMGKKFGKKMGNAAIFGAGATIGSNIVNGIF